MSFEMLTRSAAIASQTPAEEHPYSVDQHATRYPLPAERRLLLLLAAARLAACEILDNHDGDSEYRCGCFICKTTSWAMTSMDFAFESVYSELLIDDRLRAHLRRLGAH